jgi:hypothetical protein
VRTFDGPQPKRPSAGSSACGISSSVLVVMAWVLGSGASGKDDAQARG